MMTYIQAIILGALQGAAELFPISSLGHSVILPSLLGWHIDQGANYFLVFLVATHLATSLVLLGFFLKDWILIAKGMLRSLAARSIDLSDPYSSLGWLIVVATVPAGILGLLFEEKLKTLFASPIAVSIFLIGNAGLLYGAELLKKRRSGIGAAAASGESDQTDTARISLSWASAIKIGCAQALALIPGFSRTGATLAGGLLVGLDHERAARFSFLLATPIILAAAALKLPDLALTGYSLGPVLAGAAMAAIGAYLSVKFLLRYFESKTLAPFAIYCAIAGALSLAILSL